ncbi:MAG: HAMP domain-containing sensor histidine kinase [Eubacteriales bacterium]|nr:HAMP domain-containing sensor histidine kinase [Eubacteriales bacterium]
MDAGLHAIIHNHDGTVHVDPTSGSPSTTGVFNVEIIVNAERRGKIVTDTIRHGDTTARIAVLPTAFNENKTFVISIYTDDTRLRAPLKIASIRLGAYTGMIVAGIALLFFLLTKSIMRNNEDRKELELLQEKTEKTEELIRQTKELAHHQRLESIGTLTSSIAHEFNNLLTPIMGYSLMMLEKIPPEETDMYDGAIEIYEASKKAKDIISRLNQFSRKDQSSTFKLVNPEELIKHTLEVVKPAKPENVELKSDISCNGAWIYGNETQLSQLILNLILNAFQATEKKGGSVTVSARENEDRLILKVADTGCGIPEEVLPHIFEPFYSTKETGKGTGLGLAIVQQIAEQHGAEIDVKTGDGGTEFTITVLTGPSSKQ